ncbi:MAG: Gfo/Idh/MocA family oxidoreductase [Anaerolineae bacterium]|nr:Gfo/Idh/MocA family oxidoreductase [Anaerolineae bacterium]
MKIGIIGAGQLGRSHALRWRQLGATVDAVYDTVRPSAERLAADVDGTVVDSVEELIRRVDVVDVNTPPTAHREPPVAALQAGRPVVCEKPLARNLADGRAMVEASEATGTPLYVAHVVRFFPEYNHLHSLVANGAIGKPGVYRSSRLGTYPQWGGWFADEAESGGVILDVMIHDFDFARWCCGEVTRIFVRRRRWAGPPPGEHAFALLRFAGGAIGHIEGGWNRPRGIWTTKIEIAGDGGLVEVDNSAPPLALHLHSGNRPPLPVTEDDPYLIELGHFMDCLEGRAQPIVTARDALAALEISLAGMESARTGRAVTLSHGEV